jgi:hypothetical protein
MLQGLTLGRDLDQLRLRWDDRSDRLSSCRELQLRLRLGGRNCDDRRLADHRVSNLNDLAALLCQLLRLLEHNRLSPWDDGSLPPPPSPPSGPSRYSNGGLPDSVGS